MFSTAFVLIFTQLVNGHAQDVTMRESASFSTFEQCQSQDLGVKGDYERLVKNAKENLRASILKECQEDKEAVPNPIQTVETTQGTIILNEPILIDSGPLRGR